MPSIAEFKINFYKLLEENGKIIKNPLTKIPDLINDYQKLLNLYTAMQKTRLFDAKAINLQRTGKISTYPSYLWHEAIGIAVGNSMQPNDTYCPYYRDLGTMLWRGVLMEEILAYWGGFNEGSNFKYAKHDFPISVPIASQTLHAVGAAFAFKYQKLPNVAVTTVGDGGTSRGDFYEALNLAKVWKLPVVFVIINNKWAISTPQNMQTSAKTLAQKAIAAGMTGEQVDGNDLFALISRLDIAIQKARDNYEPTVIEALTYRMNDHTTADDASRYRDLLEKEKYMATDPLLRLKIFLQEQYNFSENDDLKIKQECQAAIETAVNNYLNMHPAAPSSIFENLYEQLPDPLKYQRDLL